VRPDQDFINLIIAGRVPDAMLQVFFGTSLIALTSEEEYALSQSDVPSGGWQLRCETVLLIGARGARRTSTATSDGVWDALRNGGYCTWLPTGHQLSAVATLEPALDFRLEPAPCLKYTLSCQK
jgi:hypothetical protein